MNDTQAYIQFLEQEIEVLRSTYDPLAEGTGHYNTALGVLKQRIEQLKQK